MGIGYGRRLKEGKGKRVATRRWSAGRTLLRLVVRAAVGMCLPVAGFAAEPAASGAITWAAMDFPPLQILGGAYRGSGGFDGLLELLMKQLPDYRHDIVPMSFARLDEELREGRELCTPGVFRTPGRDRTLVYSLPALLHLDNRLVFLASRADRFGHEAAVDLEALVKRTDLVGGIISERSFAPNVDRILRERRITGSLVRRPLKAFQMFELLVSGQIDYTILSPPEVAYLTRQMDLREELVVRPIAGTPPYIFTHVACTRGAWGEGVIRRVDALLREGRQAPEYRALSERWCVDTDRALIRRYYPRLLASLKGGDSP